jgi:hypothetical protein
LGNSMSSTNSGSTGSTSNGGTRGVVHGPASAFF